MAGGYDGEIRIRTLIENGKASSQLLQLEARFQKTAKEAARLEDEMRKLEQQKIPTEEYANLENKLKDIMRFLVIFHFTDNITIISYPVCIKFLKKCLAVFFHQECLDLCVYRHFWSAFLQLLRRIPSAVSRSSARRYARLRA